MACRRAAVLVVALASCGWLLLDAKADLRERPTSEVRFTISTDVVPAEYFGLHIHRGISSARFPEPSPWPNVRFRAWRLWDALVDWPRIQPQAGDWDFRLLDSTIAVAEARGIRVMLTLGPAPWWAVERRSGRLRVRSQAWRTYVDSVARRYRGRIEAVELWNEPNLPDFYSGSPEELVSLAVDAFDIIKRIDSTIIVVSPSPAGESGLEWLDTYLGHGGARAADVIGFHAYAASPEGSAKLIRRARELANKHGLSGKPLWNTEAGWHVRTGSATGDSVLQMWRSDGVSADSAAALTARSLILGWVSGAQRFYWYAWDNYAMGMLDERLRPLPAAAAYDVVADWMVGRSVVAAQRDVAGIWQVDLEGRGAAVRLLWSEEGVRTINLEGWPVRRVGLLDATTRVIGPGDDIEIGPAPVMLLQ